MITFKKLSWSNCFSYGENNTVHLNDSTVTQIIGENAAGKSSVALILEEVLYNKNSKGIKKADIANRNSEGTYSITLDFSIDEVDYRIDLTRSKTLKIKLTRDKEDISSHTAVNTFKTIENLMGVDFKTFAQLVYQNTNSSLQFLTATDTTRKKFLIDLLGLEKYMEYHNEFKSKAKELVNRVSTISAKVETIESWLVDNELQGEKHQPTIKYTLNTEVEDKALATLQLEKTNIHLHNSKVQSNNNKRTRLESHEIQQVVNLQKSSLIDGSLLTAELGGLHAEQASIMKVLQKLKGLKGQCPTCSQEIGRKFKESFSATQNARLAEILVDADRLSVDIEAVKNTNKETLKQNKLIQEFETLLQSIDTTLPEETTIEGELDAKIGSLTKCIKETKKKFDAVTKENIKIEKNNTKVKIYLEQASKYSGQLDEQVKELTKVQHELQSAEVLKKAFSTNGLLAYKIEVLVKELEHLTNIYLAELSDGKFTIEFKINKDKLNVNITDNGLDIAITALSSGELSRVNIATLLSIRKLMNSISKSQINLLFLDEIINVLDAEGRSTVVDVLVKETDLSTFIISHQWEHPLLTKLNIVKRNGNSEVLDGS